MDVVRTSRAKLGHGLVVARDDDGAAGLRLGYGGRKPRLEVLNRDPFHDHNNIRFGPEYGLERASVAHFRNQVAWRLERGAERRADERRRRESNEAQGAES